MAFKEGKKPALVVPKKQLRRLVEALSAAGYSGHDGQKVRRPNEIITMRRHYVSRDEDRQCHVQIVEDGEHMLVYAHTEPFMGRDVVSLIRHGISAVSDEASFSAGSRMLRRDLGKKLKTLG